MAVESRFLCIVADRILGMLCSKDFQDVGAVWGVHDVLDQLERTILELRPLLRKLETQAFAREEEWRIDEYDISHRAGKSEELLEEAVSLLEDLACGANYLQPDGSYKMPEKVRRFFSNPKHFKLNNIREILEALNEIRLAETRAPEGQFAFESDYETGRAIQFPNGVEEVESFIVQGGVPNSWDHVAKIEIINILLDMKFEQNVTVLPLIILDWKATSTFSLDVFNDGRVQKHFHKRIWISGIDSFDNPILVLRAIAEHIAAGPKAITDHRDELIKLISSSLSGVRYLIVLSRSWNSNNPEYWLFLRDLIGIGDRGSKIIVTTSKEEVAISIKGTCSTIQPYRLACPSEDELWSLFEKVAFGHEQPKSKLMINVGKKIVNAFVTWTIGLPLVIEAIGSMLYFEASEAEWQLFCKNEDAYWKHRTFPYSILQFNEEDYNLRYNMVLLERCYDHLPLPLKHCFGYCCLFPIDYEIDVQTMIKLWMAQGFIIDEPGKSVEDVGYEYFLNLLRRSFFQEPKIDVRRRVIKCKMHPLMHHLATLLARKECYLFSPDAFHKYDNISPHVSFGFDLFTAEVAKDFSWRYARSFLLQSQLWEKYSGRHANYDAIISRCGLLRALDLRAIGIRTVPSSIGELKFLKYLDLSENGDITKLPNSITNLLKLQTLKLSSCFKLRELPRDIQNLVNLRHLEIDGCYNLTSLPRGFGKLTNLRTLSRIVLSHDSKMHDVELDAVKGLINLIGEFQIKNLRHEKDVTVYVNVVPCGVRSLSLEWDSHAPKSNDKETPTDQSENLFTNLEELTVNGFNGVTLFSPGISSKMVKLTLRRCANCQYLPSLDQLLHLKVLLLDEMIKLVYISNKDSSSASATFFPCLQELWLTELPQLQGWWENGVNDLTASFPCLSRLVIEDCPNLATMPLFPTLEEGLVLDTTCWKPFELTMEQKTTAAYDEASSSTSPPPSAPLSKLKNLSIVGIKDCRVDEIKWETLNCLRFLRFDCLPNLTTLPEGLRQVTSLQELHVWRCGIREIPNWINKLEQLKKLAIRVCSSLKSLPEEIRSLHSLETLEIEDCNTLLRRCEKEIGADWEKIVPIPYKRLGPISGR